MDDTNIWCEFCEDEHKSKIVTYFDKQHHVCDECAASVIEQEEGFEC